MILQFACLFLVVTSTISKELTTEQNAQIIQQSQSSNSSEAKETLRKEDKWKNVSKGLVNFVECTDSAASHIPPITIGTYKNKIKNCTKNYSTKKLKQDSEDALNKTMPRKYKPVFTCFSKIEPKEDDKDIPLIMQCLNIGTQRTTMHKHLTRTSQSLADSSKFAEAFERCISRSNRKGNEEKVNNCMTTFAGNEDTFYNTFGPGSTR
ncbi:hypothetical protein O0L34_g15141 [Tuta absoluta]|nr:hypothetical protein O0L34_g15141 [Tuta absoluta]